VYRVFIMLSLRFKRLLVVIKQTAYEEYSQLKLRGQAPKALRWKRLESRYESHKTCVTNLLSILRHHNVDFACINRVELDRQHLSGVDLVVAVGGDGTVLSAAHFLDHGTIPLLGINSDPTSEDDKSVKKKSDERRSHGALCMCTAQDMDTALPPVLYGDGHIETRTRIQTVVKSTFAETRLVPALNDMLIANPSPAAVSRFRMGWLQKANQSQHSQIPDTQIPNCEIYGTVTRFSGIPYSVTNSINVWSSGMWVSTATGSSAAMAAAGGKHMNTSSRDLQYLIREHMIENHPSTKQELADFNNKIVGSEEQLTLRWNSQKGRIFIDGSHLSHNLELGDEILINAKAPPLSLFTRDAAL